MISMSKIPRQVKKAQFQNNPILKDAGLQISEIIKSINHTYKLLDIIDDTLTANGLNRLSELLDLASLSSIIGNFLVVGIQNASNRRFVSNQPHRYPDLIATTKNASNIEIKVALENNKPKGHLAKDGYYLTFRYFLGDESCKYMKKPHRGNMVWIWEVRFGFLNIDNFSTSSTVGDSGKTAPINKEGWKKMHVIFSEKIT